jgi:major vault protein
MPRQGGSGGSDAIYRIGPREYLHVLNQNTNITRLVVGPTTFMRQDNEMVVEGPSPMIVVPPRHHCVITNPVARKADGSVEYIGDTEQVKVLHAQREIRLEQEPFCLYPGEVMSTKVTPLTVVAANSALRLKAILDFTNEDGEKVGAGSQWLFEGPATYIPRVEVAVEETIRASIIRPNQALRLRALESLVDSNGVKRVTGEEWLISKVGAYLPQVYEEIQDTVDAYVLTAETALHVRAIRNFTDQFGHERKTGEEWLITFQDAETHICSVYEEVVTLSDITTLTNRQYAVIVNPVDEHGKPQLGSKKLVKGPSSFFLQPGESLQNGVQDVYILSEEEGLILKCNEAHEDGDVKRNPGDRWMIRGPAEYVPPVQVEIVAKRVATPLDDNEGIYVRNIKTGKVRAVIGQTYMLDQNEELYEKKLPPNIEQLLATDRDPLADRSERNFKATKTRDRTRVITYRVPHNAAVQIYDYKEKKARVCFGPDLVMLGPDEQFTQLSLSGGKPKRPNQIKSLCLLLGPDFCTDIISIETADHARLNLQLSYNWHFEVDRDDGSNGAKLFSVPDFVGDMCKAVASRVRGAVASVQFDNFHKNSARIIRASVFGLDDNGKVRDSFRFPANNLVITSIDIQSAEPVDQRTRDALQKSVQLAIEITTSSQEAAAKHQAQRLEQEARGALERQALMDQSAAEAARKELLELQAISAAVESTGLAKAEAEARAEAEKITSQAAVAQAKLTAEARSIEAESELTRLQAAREAEILYLKQQNELEVAKAKELAGIEAQKFKDTVDAIGAETIAAIARAGPEMQAKLLQGLGLQSTLITDGSSPINLFQTANGLIGNTPGAAPASQ